MKLNKCAFAFTLAEVLITIGVIGVVAAMTIPTLVTNYQKHKVETRLKGFYANINNAMRLSQEENGEFDCLTGHPDAAFTYDQNVEFLQKYFVPFIKISNYRQCSVPISTVCVDLLDGGTMSFNVTRGGGIDISYMINTYHNKIDNSPRNRFYFRYTYNSTANNERDTSSNFIRPYDWNWDGTREGLKNSTTYPAASCKKGCNSCGYCAKLIQMNGWKIPDDYPW